MQPKWTKDAAAEQQIRDFGAKFEIRDVSLDEIDWEESRQNGARSDHPIDDTLVADYVLPMKRGEEFPMCVALPRKTKKVLILGGNHRSLAARDCGATKIPCYVVESEDSAVTDGSANMRHKMTNRQKTDLALLWIRRALHDEDAANYETTEALKRISDAVRSSHIVLHTLKLVNVHK